MDQDFFLSEDDWNNLRNNSYALRENESDVIFKYLLLMSSIVGVVSDFLIAATLISSGASPKRTIISIATWTFADVLLLTAPAGLLARVLALLNVLHLHELHQLCFVINSDVMLHINCTIIMMLIIFDRLMSSRKISDPMFAITLCLLIVTNVARNYYWCYGGALQSVYVSSLIAFAFLLLCMVVKEIALWKSGLLNANDDIRLRFNLARIYTYNWTLFFVVYYADYAATQHLVDFLRLSTHLTSFYMLLYMINAKWSFRNSFLDFVTCCSSSDPVDATVTYRGDHKTDQQNIFFDRFE